MTPGQLATAKNKLIELTKEYFRLKRMLRINVNLRRRLLQRMRAAKGGFKP